MDHLDPYITRLLVPSPGYKSISIFTLDGNSGLGLDARDEKVAIKLTVEWRQESEREAAIRSFFSSRNILATSDYLAANGGVSNSTRLLEYELQGDVTAITTITKDALMEIFEIKLEDPLEVQFFE